MMLAFDSYYYDDKAKTVALLFENWIDDSPKEVLSEILTNIAEYEPGAFYKRELPCMLSLLQQIDLATIEAIIIDGFVVLDDAGKLGLGGHLYEFLQKKIPVIGVAKTNFATIINLKRAIYRGGSKNPLYITALGMDLDQASTNIQGMYGNYRIPSLLKLLDSLTKTI